MGLFGFGSGSSLGSNGGAAPARVALASDGAGGVLATSRFSGTGNYGGTSLTSNGADALILRVSNAPAITWAASVSGSCNQEGYGITSDGAGGALVTGAYQCASSFGSTQKTPVSGYDAFVTRVASGGSPFSWVRSVGHDNRDAGSSIAADGSGGAFVTGFFRKTVNFGGAATLTVSYALHSCAPRRYVLRPPRTAEWRAMLTLSRAWTGRGRQPPQIRYFRDARQLEWRCHVGQALR